MTPKDWDKIEKLLGPMADQKTVEAVKTLVEGIETNLKGSLTANVVKSVQRGVITLSHDKTSASATIQAVDTSKAFVLYGGVKHESGNYAESDQKMNMIRLHLANATTVTAERGSSINAKSIAYEVVEFY